MEKYSSDGKVIYHWLADERFGLSLSYAYARTRIRCSCEKERRKIEDHVFTLTDSSLSLLKSNIPLP